MKGKLIVVEGLDRTGKSTIADYLTAKLNQDSETVKQRFPDRTTHIGRMIDEFLQNRMELDHQVIHLLFSANRWELLQTMKQKLEAGVNIICDRYWYSGVAYSYAKGLNLKWCEAPDKGLLTPDLVIVLKGDPKELAKRAGYGEQRFQKVQFQAKVKEAFDALFSPSDPTHKIIDVSHINLEELKDKVSIIVNEKFSTPDDTRSHHSFSSNSYSENRQNQYSSHHNRKYLSNGDFQ